MFRKSFQTDERMLKQWDNVQEMKRPLSGRIAGTFLHQNYVPRLEVPSLQNSLPYSSGIYRHGARKTHMSKKVQLRREHLRGDALPQPLLFVQKKMEYILII